MSGTRALLFGILLVAVALRVGAVVVYRAYAGTDLWEVEPLVVNMLSGRGFVYDHFGTEYWSYQEPLYPFLTYAVYGLTNHSHLAMALVHVLLSSALVGATYAIAAMVFTPAVASWAAAAVAIDPGLIRYVVKFHPLVLDALLMALVALAVLRAGRSPRAIWYIVLGGVLGLCVLTRPTILAFLPFALGWLFVTSRGGVARRTWLLGLALAVAAVTVAPWVVRNYRVHHRFVLTRTNTPFVFWLGNNPRWSGSSMATSGQPLLDTVPEVRDRILGLREIAQNDLFRDEALRFVSQDPISFLGRTAVKFWYFWWFSPQFGLLYAESLWVYRYFYVAMLILAAVGLALAVGGHFPAARRGEVALLFAFLMSISVSQSLFYIEGRHRLAVESVMLVFSGAGMAAALSRLRREMPARASNATITRR